MNSRAMRRYTLFCRRWRRANAQLARLGAEAPSPVVTPYNPITADKILHYFRHLPDDQINQARWLRENDMLDRYARSLCRR